MTSLAFWENAFWYLSIAATALLLLKMWREGLLGNYRWFSAYLGWGLISAAVLFGIPRRSHTYIVAYFSFEAVFWILFTLTTLELFTSVLRQYPGIATMGRAIIGISVGVALAIALFSMYIGPDITNNPRLIVKFSMSMLLIGRAVSLSVLLFLIIMTFALFCFPVPLPANAVRFLLGYTVCFAARSVGYFSVTLRGMGVVKEVSTICLAAAALCLCYWVVRLNARGEQSKLVVAHHWSSEGEERLLNKMAAINSSLSKSRRGFDPPASV